MTNGACYGVQKVDDTTPYQTILLPRPAMLVGISVRSTGLASCYFEGDISGISSHTSTISSSGMVLSIIASPHVRAALFEHVQ